MCFWGFFLKETSRKSDADFLYVFGGAWLPEGPAREASAAGPAREASAAGPARKALPEGPARKALPEGPSGKPFWQALLAGTAAEVRFCFFGKVKWLPPPLCVFVIYPYETFLGGSRSKNKCNVLGSPIGPLGSGIKMSGPAAIRWLPSAGAAFF